VMVSQNTGSGQCQAPLTQFVDNAPAIISKEGYVAGYDSEFRGFRMSSGGKYKACMCDSTRSKCQNEKDFDLEVGKVYVTGIYCLLKEEQYRRRTCVQQATSSGSGNVNHVGGEIDTGLVCGSYTTSAPKLNPVNSQRLTTFNTVVGQNA